MSTAVFPSRDTWITPRTNQVKVDSNNCVVITPQKISDLNRVLVRGDNLTVCVGTSENSFVSVKVSSLYAAPNDDARFEYVDITKYVVEQAKYNTLPLIKSDSDGDLVSELSINNALYYVRNDNMIHIVNQQLDNQVLDWFKTVTVWNMTIAAAIDDQLTYRPNLIASPYIKRPDGTFTIIPGGIMRVDKMKNNPMEAQFRVYYTPLGESVKLKSVKVNPQPQQFTIPFSQQQPIVNNTTMGKEMQSIANRTGCETMQVPRVIPSMQYYRAPGTIYKEKDKDGNFTGNVWRLTSCELLIYSDTYIKVLETWSKNWTYRSPNVPINREFRSWDIPADIVQRNLHYNDYCIFSRRNLSQQLPDNAIISGSARKMLAYQLQNQEGVYGEMSNVWFMRESVKGSNNPDIGAVLSCSAFGFGTSVVFTCKTKDNLSAGVQRVEAKTGDSDYQFCKDVYYCDADGRLEDVWIQAASAMNYNNLAPMTYPSSEGISPGATLLFRTTGEKTNKFHIQKDPSEQLNFTYQLHFLSADGFLVIGSALAANNPLVKTPDKPNKIKQWGLFKAIPNGLPVMTKEYGEEITNRQAFRIYTQGTDDNISFLLTFTPRTYKGVCVTDENDNVLLAYNNSEQAAYSGHFTHNYEDIYDALFNAQDNETAKALGSEEEIATSDTKSYSLQIKYKNIDLSTRVTSPIEIEQQLDTSLDSGTLNYLITEPDGKGLNEALAPYTVAFDKGPSFDFIGTDSRALLRREGNGQSIYKHQVALTEPSKLLQGIMIDGFGVTQPEDYDDRKSLSDVVNRLLDVTPFDGRRFTLTADTTVVDELTAVKSPEFRWNSQTTLWECLIQVGAVIDAIPRLVADSKGNYTVVTFDFVNAYAGEENSIDDEQTNVVGENIDESQYNTALSSIVENLRENE